MKSKKIWVEWKIMVGFDTIICGKDGNQGCEQQEDTEQKGREPKAIGPIRRVR